MAQTENVFPIWADLSSPDSVFRQVVSNRRSYSQFNIRGFAAAGWQDAHKGDSASSSAMFAALASHFEAISWMRAPSIKKSLIAGVPAKPARKKRVWDRIQRPVDAEDGQEKTARKNTDG